jgi:hypothetical protein
MGGGADDEAHGPTRPVLWDEERIGIVLGEDWEGCGVPFPDPAETPEVVRVKLGGETGVGGDGEVVEHVAKDAGVFRRGDGTRGEGMGEGVLEGGVDVVEPGERGGQGAGGFPDRAGRGGWRDAASLWGGLVVGADALLHAEGGVERHGRQPDTARAIETRTRDTFPRVICLALAAWSASTPPPWTTIRCEHLPVSLVQLTLSPARALSRTSHVRLFPLSSSRPNIPM